MIIGTTYKGNKILHMVTIDGRGGDSKHNEFFGTKEAAIFASAHDGKNRRPLKITVEEYSDGTLRYRGEEIHISEPLDDDVMTDLRDVVLASMTPAQRLLLKQAQAPVTVSVCSYPGMHDGGSGSVFVCRAAESDSGMKNGSGEGHDEAVGDFATKNGLVTIE